MIATSIYLYQKRKQKKIVKEEELKRASDKHDYKLAQAEDEVETQFSPTETHQRTQPEQESLQYIHVAAAPPSTPPPEYSPPANRVTESTSTSTKSDSGYASHTGSAVHETCSPSVYSTQSAHSAGTSNLSSQDMTHARSPFPVQPAAAAPYPPNTFAEDAYGDMRGKWVFVPERPTNAPARPAQSATPSHAGPTLAMPAEEHYQAWPQHGGFTAELPAAPIARNPPGVPTHVVELPADIEHIPAPPDDEEYDSTLIVEPLRVPDRPRSQVVSVEAARDGEQQPLAYEEPEDGFIVLPEKAQSAAPKPQTIPPGGIAGSLEDQVSKGQIS